RELVARLGDAFLEAVAPDVGEMRLVGRLFALAAQIEHRLLRFLHALQQLRAAGLARRDLRLLGREILLELRQFVTARSHLRLEAGNCAADGFERPAALREVEVTEAMAELAVTQRLRRLPLQRADLP